VKGSCEQWSCEQWSGDKGRAPQREEGLKGKLTCLAEPPMQRCVVSQVGSSRAGVEV
jgi:hypothetical protein